MSTRGFSLVDLIVAIVLIGVFAAIALPRISTNRSRFAVRHAADEFVSAHQMARAIALRSGRVAQIQIDPDANRFWVVVDTSVARTGALDTIGPVRDMSQHKVTFTSTKTLLCFDGRGLATPVWECPTADATLIFSGGEYSDTVRTTLTGKVLRR